VADHCFRSRNYVNLIVIDKQPQLQWLDMDAAVEHCVAGASIWAWASNDQGGEPDVVLASAGDIATLEVAAAAWLLRKHAPSLKVRVVNVVDLMCLLPQVMHPHGLEEAKFIELFTKTKPVVFAFHGYPRAVHAILHGRTNTERFHVRGFIDEGTTTTPFDMVVRNKTSRFHLCAEALRRSRYPQAGPLMEWCQKMLAKHETYTREHFEDMPEVGDWVWTCKLRLRAAQPRASWLAPDIRDVIAPHMLMLEEVRRHDDDFDVLHFHLDYWPFSMFSGQKLPFATTPHGRLDLSELPMDGWQ
jgi:xylulose-5-phosphate/fructose-6-phosphate phosphoketolase